jgi:hypothetical protein
MWGSRSVVRNRAMQFAPIDLADALDALLEFGLG